MTEDKRKTMLSFLQDRSVGVLATLSPQGTPRARTMYYSADDSFAIYFCTLAGTRKVGDVSSDAHGAFVVSDENAPQTIQIEGTISNLTETAVLNDEVRRLLGKVMERGPFFAPLTHLDPGKVELYKLTPTLVRFGDFTDGIGSGVSFTEIEL